MRQQRFESLRGFWCSPPGGRITHCQKPQARSFLNFYKESRFLHERCSTFRDGRKTRSTIYLIELKLYLISKSRAKALDLREERGVGISQRRGPLGRRIFIFIRVFVLRTPAAGHRRPLVSSNCGSICKSSADICEWLSSRAIPEGAILDGRVCKNGQKWPFRIDCLHFQKMEAFRDQWGSRTSKSSIFENSPSRGHRTLPECRFWSMLSQ